MPTPWNYGPVEFEVPAGESSLVELKVPARGIIKSIRLNQLDGAADGSFRLFNSVRAARSVIGSSQSSDVPGEDPDAYSICGVKTIVDGNFEEFSVNYEYRNSDGSFSLPERRLWMIIAPTGAGTLAYSLAMTITPADPS